LICSIVYLSATETVNILFPLVKKNSKDSRLDVPESKEKVEDKELKPIMIGDEVVDVRSLLELSYPMREGIIINREDMSLLWEYCIKEKLKIDGDLKDRKLLLTEAPSNPNDNKKKMGEILFEEVGVGYFNIEPQAKLTLFCEGLETGIILDSGDGVSHCIPIAFSCLLHHQIKRLDIAGRNITEYLIKLLQIKGYAFIPYCFCIISRFSYINPLQICLKSIFSFYSKIKTKEMIFQVNTIINKKT